MKGQGHGSSGRAPAYKAQGPEFKSKSQRNTSSEMLLFTYQNGKDTQRAFSMAVVENRKSNKDRWE
jgi:hypothetical protein